VNRTHNSVLFTFITDRMITLIKQSIKDSGHDDSEISNSLHNGWQSKSVTQRLVRNSDLEKIYKEMLTYSFYHLIKIKAIPLFLDVWMQLILISLVL
jgi:hypothetical protein